MSEAVDTIAANEVKATVAVEKESCDKQAAEAGALAASCQADLDKALPALEGAISALKSLSLDTDYRIYDWMDVTMEVYYVTSCEEMANGWMHIDNIAAYTTNGRPVPPDWADATGASDCNGEQRLTDHSWSVRHNV